MKRTLAAVGLVALLGCDEGTTASSGGTTTATTQTTTTTTTATTATPSATATAEPAPQSYNVVLLTIDSLRQDMPWQGYDKDIAPNLTALAKESAVYPRAYSIASFTSKSVGAILSGKLPSTLYRSGTFFTEYSKANLFFPELLQEKGIKTLAGHAHLYFDKGKNLRQGFDDWRLVDGLTWNNETDESITSDKLTPLAQEMLGTVGDKRFFAWFHYMDPHDKYRAHPESPKFGKGTRALYDGEVFYTDLWVGKLFDWAKTQPWYDQTIWIISSDHGEAIGDHGQYGHGFALWDVLTRVPLIVHGPGVKARVIEERRTHIDLAPTIMDLLGQEQHPQFIGKSMRPELFGAEPDNREPILLDLPVDSYNPRTRVIVKGDYKLIEDPGPKYKLYNLTDDPAEKNNLADNPKHAAAFEDMKKTFETAWAPYEDIVPYGPQSRKLIGGGTANGPKGPPGWKDPDEDDADKGDGDDAR